MSYEKKHFSVKKKKNQNFAWLGYQRIILNRNYKISKRYIRFK